MKTLTKDDKQNFIIVLLSALLFYVNNLIKYKVEVPYLGYILRNHFNDFLGGIAFITVVNIILYLSKYNRIKKYIIIVMFAILASVFWEVITPIFKSNSYGDILDVLSYVLGFSFYWIFKKYILKNNAYTFR